MPTLTKIEWTDYSTNPLKYRDRETGKVVWACVHKSDGCTHCYAETLAKRWHRGRAFIQPNIDLVEPFIDRAELVALTNAKSLAGKRVFVADMTDLFGEWVDFDLPRAVFGVFARRQDVIWQVLTKRPERMAEFIRITTPTQIYLESQDVIHDGINHFDGKWPLPNVWVGTSVENNDVRGRIDHLMDCPAMVRFLSVEPMIGPVDLAPWLCADGMECRKAPWLYHHYCPDNQIQQVIAGGESGSGKRPLDLQWARDLRDQCKAAGVPFFFKQVDQRQPIPDDLMVREFPMAVAV